MQVHVSLCFPATPHQNLKERKEEMANIKKWSAEQIIRWWVVNTPKMTYHKALDIFSDAVENYKQCAYKDKLYYVALSFILAANVTRIDFLTGAQAFEVADNVATDFGADKIRVQNQINKIMKELEKKGTYDGKRFNI